MQKSKYREAQRIKPMKGNPYKAPTAGAFGFCLKPAGSKLKAMISVCARVSTGYYRAAGRLGIKPMGIIANYFADKRKRV